MSNFSYQDLYITIGFLFLCLVIGLIKTTHIKNLKDFTLGNKNLSTTTLVCIIFASAVGAGNTLGISSKIYEFGAIFVISQLLSPLYWLMTMKVIGYNIGRFKSCITLGEIAHKLYGNLGRWVICFTSILRSLGSIAAQAIALGVVFKYFMNIDPSYGILIGYSIIAIYSALGGIRAVIHTEIFKFVVFFFIIPIAYLVVFSDTGGLLELTSTLPMQYFSIKLSDKNISLLASFAIYSLLPGIEPAFIQRCLIAQNSKKLVNALKMIAFISIPFSGALCLIAYNVRATFPNINPDAALLHFIALLPDGLRGLMLCGIIAAIMSMAEAKLNATSAILVNDIIKVLRPTLSNVRQVLAARFTTVILTISSLALTRLSTNILELIWFVANFWEPIIAIPIISGFLGFKANTRSFLVSVLIAIFSTVTAGLIASEFAIISWCFGILGSAIGLFGMHYLQASKDNLGLYTILHLTIQNVLAYIFNSKATILATLKEFTNTTLQLITHNPGNHLLEIRRFCIFTFAYYFMYSLAITNTYDHKILVILISIGYTLCLALLFREYYISKGIQEKYLHYYWYFLLTFCLPFVSSYIVFIGHHDPFWIINGLLSAFSLYLFVDARRFLLLYSIGVIGGLTLFTLTGHNINTFQEITAVSYIGYIYLFFLFASLFFFRKRELEHEDKITTMELFGGAMAHEVKTPLAGIKMYAETMNNIIQDSTQKKLKYTPGMVIMTREDAATLQKFSQTLEEISMHGIKTVDGLLNSLRTQMDAHDIDIYFIEDILKSTIAEYSSFHPERNNIELDIKDNFQFHGSKQQVGQILINLLNNTHKYAGINVKIKIWCKNNKLHFKDYGKGIREEELSKIFDKFYTQKKGGGTGIGLSLCKEAMQNMNGSIECKSQLGKYTEFILYFPKIRVKKISKQNH